MPCHIFFRCLLEVDSIWTFKVQHLECYTEGCEQLEPQDIWLTALLYVGWGASRGLNEGVEDDSWKLKMIGESHVSMQSFNTLSFLSLHVLGRDLGVKCFSVLHSAVTSSVQRFRSWSDLVFFEVWSESICVGNCPPQNLSVTIWCRGADSPVNSLHLILCFIFPELPFSCFCWVKSRITRPFAFLFSCPPSCLASALLDSAQWLQAVAPLQPWRFLGSSSTSVSLSLGFLLCLEQHLMGLLSSMGFSIPAMRFSWLSSSGPCCLSVVYFPAILCLTCPSLCFSQKWFSLPRICLIISLSSLLLPDRTAFDLFISKSIALSRHVPRDPVSQAYRPTDP